MAAERDLELLDDYLSNRLRGQDRTVFEQKLQSDPGLKSEYQLQQKLVEAIKNARAAELKSMLNNTPVPSVGGGIPLFTKLAAGFVVAGLIGAGAYLFVNHGEETTAAQEPTVEQPNLANTTQAKPEITGQETQPATLAEKPVTESHHEKRTRTKAERKAKAALEATQEEKITEKRKLEVFDPTRENETNTTQNTVKPGVTEEESSIAVETDNTNKKYTFHYQFKADKLILYGSFEKNLYEVLEFFSDNKRTVFLYHKDSYYLLNDENEKIKPLTPVGDPVLIKKLKEYRGN